jgi:2-phosphosulfolactate phosphatase
MHVDVLPLPPEPDSPLLDGRTCLVVDVLRATSSMAVLLASGIEAIYPAGSIEEGRSRREALEEALGRRVLLCGESHALPPEGYDFGNSPSELAEVLAGGLGGGDPRWREAVVATTNGTRALLACRAARLVLAAAPLNAGAATQRALDAGDDVLVVCSGTDGQPSDDDYLAAGLLVDRLVTGGAEVGGGASDALEARRRYLAVATDLGAAFADVGHGRRLIELGFGHDLAFCAEADRFAVAAAMRIEDGVPVLRPL